MRMVKDGPLVAVMIWHGCPVDPVTGELLTERPALWRCKINGQDDAISTVLIEMDGLTGLPVLKAEPIEELEYDYLVKSHQWAAKYAPDAPEANPRKRIDLNALPPLKF